MFGNEEDAQRFQEWGERVGDEGCARAVWGKLPTKLNTEKGREKTAIDRWAGDARCSLLSRPKIEHFGLDSRPFEGAFGVLRGLEFFRILFSGNRQDSGRFGVGLPICLQPLNLEYAVYLTEDYFEHFVIGSNAI